MDFSSLTVPIRTYGEASAVLWTADEMIQRNYTIAYDRKADSFVVTGYSTSKLAEDGTYQPVPNDLSRVFTELSQYFEFSTDFEQLYLLYYIGEGDNIEALRAAYEQKQLANLTEQQLADFEVCDLGGNTLILLVPRYMGLNIWINKIDHKGNLMRSGAEQARFKNGRPVYIYCSFSDMLPDYEVHVSFDAMEQFFTTNEKLLEHIKESSK